MNKKFNNKLKYVMLSLAREKERENMFIIWVQMFIDYYFKILN